MSGLLELDQVDTYYGQIHILQGASMRIGEGELVCLLGGNASGKSTTLKTILGIVRPRRGRTMPRIVFSVVDFPDALPPSRQTSSPSPMRMLAPCRMWICPS